jgi:hypothetical protein
VCNPTEGLGIAPISYGSDYLAIPTSYHHKVHLLASVLSHGTRIAKPSIRPNNEAFSIPRTTKEGNMKRAKLVLLQLLVIGSVIAMYALPVLADGGGGL